MGLAVLAIGVLAATASTQEAVPGRRLPEHDNAIFSMTRLALDGTRVAGQSVASWAGDGWIGTDYDRVWWSTEGERVGGTMVNAEIHAMYGHYVTSFWDVVLGYDRQFDPVGVNYVTAGVRGLAPYWFDVDAELLLSEHGQLSARTGVGTDWLLTQRLITQPQVRLDWPLMRDPLRGLNAGLGDASVGLATRYEIRREFAPYVELRWSRDVGAVRAAEQRGGGDVTGWTVRGGLRLEH